MYLNRIKQEKYLKSYPVDQESKSTLVKKWKWGHSQEDQQKLCDNCEEEWVDNRLTQTPTMSEKKFSVLSFIDSEKWSVEESVEGDDDGSDGNLKELELIAIKGCWISSGNMQKADKLHVLDYWCLQYIIHTHFMNLSLTTEFQ